MGLSERLIICTRTVSEDDVNAEKEAILSDFNSLVFEAIPCCDSSNINYNDGEEADPFDKIAKHYGRQKNVFRFISLLKDSEFSALLLDKIKEKCSTEQLEKFIERTTLYLTRIKQGEITAKDFLKDDSFSGAFFNGYYCGEKKNIHENLNINFTQPTQFLDIHEIFTRNIESKETGELRQVKIYENGQRAVTVEYEQGVRKYKFSKNASCQLVFKNEKISVYLDIIAGKVSSIEREVGDLRTVLTKASDIPDEILIYSDILINDESLEEILPAYFEEEIMLQKREWCVQEECLPIKTLEDLENWQLAEHQHVTERLLQRKKEDGPKTLVCHDMRGGCLDDRFVNGTKVKENYFFVHWQHVDTFVYFSHHLVTIPPCSWISAAHRNGVRVLGTFITEWNEGEQICNEFLKDEKSAYQLAMRLVNIAKLCNFEGWLIDIENKLKPPQVPVLRKFLSFLTFKMASFSSDSLVIWYDSVIKNGELKWQNALNDNNRMFFNACDGIFLNYNWKEEQLEESLKLAAERQTDVYVGVDVFGRGCFGGGGFASDLAVAEARDFGLSVAILAPGWVHECEDEEQFEENQFKFWSALQEYCPPRTIIEFPRSTFCPGFGKEMFRNEEVISEEVWHNLGLQSLQPIYSKKEMIIVTFDACNGGNAISFDGFIKSRDSMVFELFKTDLRIDGEFIVSFTYRLLSQKYNLEPILDLQFESSHELHLVQNKTKKWHQSQNEVFPSSKEELLELGYKEREYCSWKTRTYVVDHPDDFLESVSVRFQSSKEYFKSTPSREYFNILLGEFEILPLWPRYDLNYKDLSCEWDADKENVRVQCILVWRYQTPVMYSDLYVDIPGQNKEYLITTSQLSYKLDRSFPSIDSFNVILCPKDLGSQTVNVNIV